jgi:glycosyltransferase involved in cell wall biosynthesis
MTVKTAPLMNLAPGNRPHGRSDGLKIASCINSMSPSGGSELNAVRSVERLKLLGHDVHVLTLTDEVSGMYDRYVSAQVPIHSFPVRSLIGASAARQIWKMADFLRLGRFDVVHAHDCYTNFLMVLAARLAGIPSIASKRYIKPFQPQHRYTDWVGFRIADRVLANSRQVAAVVKNEDRISSSKITVVPNFVDDMVFSASDERSTWRHRYGYTDDHLVFGIVAQLRREKNHEMLLRAFAKVHQKNAGIRLLIVGDGPEAGALTRLTENLGMTNTVTFAGHVSSAWRTYAAIDIAVLTSDHEGFPNSVIEAMAVGRPVIATNVGGVSDAIENNVTGLLFPAGDLTKLESAMMTMITDLHFRRKIGVAAREIAERNYRSEQVMAQLEDLYNVICAK